MDIIQLRQEDAGTVNSNGDYSVVIPQPVILNPGDQIALKNCFIDTKNINDNEIVLNNPVIVEMTFIRCVRNYGHIPAASLSLRDNNDNRATLIDGDLYMECSEKTSTPPNYYLYSTVNLTQSGKVFPKTTTENYRFTYTDINGNKATKVITINNSWVKNQQTGYKYQHNLNIIALNNSVDFIDSSEAFKRGMELISGDEYDKAPYVTANRYDVVSESVSFPLEAGNYTTSQFCEIFNRELTLSIPTTTDKIGNNFLSYTTEKDTVAKISQPFIRLDGNGLIYQNYAADTSNYFIGTNQVAIEFDSNDQVFKLINHFPIYNGSDLGVKFNQVQEYNGAGTAVNIRKPFGSYGCVLFTHLSAIDTITNNDIKLFDDILGFDLKTLLIDVEYDVRDLDGVADVHLPYITDPNFDTPGISYSDAFLGIDDFVDKSSGGDFSKFLTTDFFSVNTDFTYIRSNNKFNELLNNPYFLIEISGYNTNFTDSNNIKHTMAGIVSRYYSVGSYTTSGAESSIPMINDGLVPQILKSFNVRILNPDGQLIADLGDDNCIFLQHVKNEKPLKLK